MSPGKKTNAVYCRTDHSKRHKVSVLADFATLTKALAHPIRIQILELLHSRKTCVCGEIVDELPLAQATVSQHLKVLKKAGLIQGEISGPKTCYCINFDVLREFKSMVAQFLK